MAKRKTKVVVTKTKSSYDWTQPYTFPVGSPGIGKTATIEEHCKRMGIKMVKLKLPRRFAVDEGGLPPVMIDETGPYPDLTVHDMYECCVCGGNHVEEYHTTGNV